MGVACVAGIVLALIGIVVGVGVGVFRDAGRVPAAGFGLCSGHTPPSAPTPALTPWLHETFQTLAGRSLTDPPLTFADLSGAGITLQLMTTNLSRRQPLAMPWDTSDYYFDPAEFRTLFPEEVVDQMERSAPPPVETDKDWLAAVAAEHARPLRPFPASADLPIVVAVRMSLSFPGLISAVPLHAVDYSWPHNKEARAEAVAWHEKHPLATPAEGAAELPKLTTQRNWFSDGGICANLPLHFFDSALPRRPTFAIDLAGFPHDRVKDEENEYENSFLPVIDSDEVQRRQTEFHKDGGVGALNQFFSSIVATARTWVDEAQLSVPGYRDRVVTVFHDHDEGGMNLNMEETTVRRPERARGGCRHEAGRPVRRRRAGSQAGGGVGRAPLAAVPDGHGCLRRDAGLVQGWLRGSASRDHAVLGLGGGAERWDRGHAGAPGRTRSRRSAGAW